MSANPLFLPLLRTIQVFSPFGLRLKSTCLRCSLVLATLLLLNDPAWAQGVDNGDASKRPAADALSASAAANAADKETARNLFRLGNDKYAARDYQGALEAYEAADAIMGVPTTAYKVGKTLAAVGRLVEARDRLLRIARTPVAASEVEAFGRARNNAAALAKELRARVPSLQLEVLGVPPGTVPELWIDGRRLDAKTAALPRSLDPGAHTVIVSAEGYTTVTRRLSLAEGQRASFELIMELSAEPKAERGSDTGKSMMFVGFSVAACGATVGAVTGILSLKAASSAKDQCPTENSCPASARADIELSTTLAPISTTSFAVGGLGLGVGLLGLLWGQDDAQQDKASFRIEPVVGPASVGLSGRF